MPFSGLAAPLPALVLGAALLAAPLALGAQEAPPTARKTDSTAAADTLRRGAADSLRRLPVDSTTGVGVRLRLRQDTLRVVRPAALAPLGTMRLERPTAAEVAARRADSLRALARIREQALLREGFQSQVGGNRLPEFVGPVTLDPSAIEQITLTPEERAALDSAGVPLPAGVRGAGGRATDIFGDYADLGLLLNSRLETKLERNRNERCTRNQLQNPGLNCQGSLQPQFDFQFNVRTGGVVADRIHVNVDYDSQREFDASNNINVYYEGKSDELIERLEIGNVFFTPPSSRFITGGIPSGNYGLQAKGQLGPMRFSTIVAQQKGNRVSDRVFRIGERTEQETITDLEDYRFEARRFFWIVEPRAIPGYPNVDILNRTQMNAAVASLGGNRPNTVRLYRWRSGVPPTNPNGPQFALLDKDVEIPQGGNVYELLQPGVDYYIDPSQLWVALVRPLAAQNERLVVAYTVGDAGQVVPDVGGTPVLEQGAGQEHKARLLYDFGVTAADTAFHKEIRSVYRMGGEDLVRSGFQLRIGTGPGATNPAPTERVPGGETFLQMLGLAQATNSAAFDVENRLWPRPGDPILSQQGAGQLLIRDQFLVFPSLRPFARSRLDSAGAPGGLIVGRRNVANDTIYRLTSDLLNSQDRPAAVYFIRATFRSFGGGDVGTLNLGSVQVSRNSERIVMNGAVLKRDVDYEVDYELGQVRFLRPDTLFRSPRDVTVQYEENPLFAAAPTTIFGIASQVPFQNGQLNLVAISQNQRTTFNRPPLGFEPASSLVAGVNGSFTFEAGPLSRLLERIPNVGSTSMSSIVVSGEIATSRPQPNPAGVAYVESFEGDGGVQVPLAEQAWYFSSRPSSVAGTASGSRLAAAGITLSDDLFSTERAASLAWANLGLMRFPDVNGQPVARLMQFPLDSIDPQVRLTGQGAQISMEQVLWMSLYPRTVGGILRPGSAGNYAWRLDDESAPPPGTRWRSMRTVLNPNGIDLSRSEQLEFWALVDDRVRRGRTNPILVLDFGDISENSVAIAPTEQLLAAPAAGSRDTAVISYAGRQAAGLGVFNTERDSVTRNFDAGDDDRGLPNDVVPQLTVRDTRPGREDSDLAANVPVCTYNRTEQLYLHDTRNNCTYQNDRLDEEDIDGDFALNDPAGVPQREQLLRYVVDLNDASLYSRRGNEVRTTIERAGGGRDTITRRWVLIRLPLRSGDSVNVPNVRRVRALRLTMLSGPEAPDSLFQQVAIARMRFSGAPWVRRQTSVLAGVVAEEQVGGTYQYVSTVGTQDSSFRVSYQPPPGVVDAPEQRQSGFETGVIQINEKSIRIQAGGASVHPDSGGGIPLGTRAEAFYRFPEGQKNFMGYRELHVWARGRGKGWGRDTATAQMQFFVKMGRDPRNFYFFRRTAAAGNNVDAWTDVRVDFEQLYRLRSQVQNASLREGEAGVTRIAGCAEGDAAMFLREVRGLTEDPYLACAYTPDGMYAIFTTNPVINPPNLASIQELAVGMVRVRVGPQIGEQEIGNGVTDTLEVWADDMRLSGVVQTPGYAGQFGLAVTAGDVARFNVNLSRRDANFRQLAENPSFVTDDALSFNTAVQLEKFLPRSLGIALPFSATYSRAGQDPYYVAGSDLRGGSIAGLRTPRGSAQSYALGLRRTTPLDVPVLGALVNNLDLRGAWTSSDGQDATSERAASAYTMDMQYTVAARPRTREIPGIVRTIVGWLPDFIENNTPLRGVRQARLRWNPSNVRFSSGLARTETRSDIFTKPVTSALDTARVVTNLNHVWQNQAGIELRPFETISASWNFRSLRDLRHYDRDTISGAVVDVGSIAAAERNRFLGLDAGLETERSMNALVAYQPVSSGWVRPRIELSSSFSFQRDPNTRQVLRENVDSTGAFRLLRRLTNSQGLNSGVTLDLGRLLAPAARSRDWVRRIAGVLQPLDVNYGRTLSSGYDGVPDAPGLGYQFGLGGLDAMLRQDGRLAANVVLSNQLSVRTALNLPLGLSLSQEMRRGYDRSYFRANENRHQERESESLVLPRVNLGWNWRPEAKLLQRIFSNIGANVGYEPSLTTQFAPNFTSPDQAERSRAEAVSLPVRASLTWAFLGNLTTGATWRTSTSDTRRPGAEIVGETEDMQVDVARIFMLPKKWNLSDQVTTRLSVTRSEAQTWIPGRADARRSYQANNGRTALNFNADTQIAANLTGSMVFSRIVNYDHLSNRRNSQLVFTTVFQLAFQAGELER